jgi:PPOX class probable F420-dependent enzyme
MDVFEQFKRCKYINLETFRKSGVGVKTPVWFVQDGDVFYVQTVADSGKVKRVRNNGQVNIAPCKVDGKLVGTWLPARSHEVKEPITINRVDRLLNKKYGLMKMLFSFSRNRKGVKDTILEIQPDRQELT